MILSLQYICYFSLVFGMAERDSVLVLITSSCIFRFGGLTLSLDALWPFVCAVQMCFFTI